MKKHQNVLNANSKSKLNATDKKGNLAEQIKGIEKAHKGENFMGPNGLESVLEKDSETEKSYTSQQKPDRVEIIYKRHELRERELEEQRKLLEIQV